MNKLILAALALTASGAALAQNSGTPAIDARGIPVVSAPATAPAGANQSVTVPAGATVTVNPNQGAVFTPMAASGDMPACSKSVTDRCMQTYEGHGGGMMMGHSMMGHDRMMSHRMMSHRMMKHCMMKHRMMKHCMMKHRMMKHRKM